MREHPDGLVSLFDNAAAPQKEPQSRALLIALDMKTMRASLVHDYAHRPERLLSHFLGNAQLLSNGNVFVGWGGAPYVTEFARSGEIAFDARLPRGGQSYRALRFPWVARHERLESPAKQIHATDGFRDGIDAHRAIA